MELTAYNFGNGNTRAKVFMNTDLLNSLSSRLFNFSGTDPSLLQETSLSSASTLPSLNINTSDSISAVSKIADNTTTSGKFISVIGDGNTVNAQEGNASLSVVGSNNILNGGSGNDSFSAVGDGNIITGGLGDDTFSAVGNNTLIGGNGIDTFMLPSVNLSPSNQVAPGQSLIQDFQIGIDKLQLPTVTITTGNTFSSRIVNYNELTLTQNEQNTNISYQGNPLVELQNIPTSQLQATDFVLPQLNNITVQGLTISS